VPAAFGTRIMPRWYLALIAFAIVATTTVSLAVNGHLNF
jgi:hypothetical protein